MFSPLLPHELKAPLAGLGLCIVAAMPAFAANDDVTLSEQSMAGAIGFLALLRGQEISADDGDWLKQQWRREFEASPRTVAAEVDELALSLEQQQQGGDQLALASGRTAMVKNTYCAARQSSAPHLHRLRDILAPDGLVLAADCLLGLVVTRFDVDGLAASDALTAAATGVGHDPDNDKAEITKIIRDDFADAAPSEKSLVANGELRGAILARFWSRIDGAPEQRAVVEEMRSAAASDLRGAARQLEALALSRLGEVDYLAKAGDARLTAGAIAEYNQWLERIAGYRFSARDRAWMQQAIIDEFRSDPGKTLSEVSGIGRMNRDYTLADGAQAQADLVAGWAADLHCYLSASSNPDEVRLAEVIFRQDPVTEADCQARRISRESDRVLAEVDGQQLAEGDLDLSLEFASMVLGRPLLTAEISVVREETVQDFKKDLTAWNEQNEFKHATLREIERHGSSFFLAVDKRKQLLDPIYCSLKTLDDPAARAYIQMFERGGGIVFEDCDRQLVTTRDEVDAIVSVVNFLGLVNGRAPLDEADRDELIQSIQSEDLTKAEVSKSAIDEWWSLLSLEEKEAEVDRMKREGITPEADSSVIANFLNLIKLEVVSRNAQLQACKLAAVVSRGQANIYAAKAGRYGWNDPNSDIAGFPVDDYTTLVTSNSLFAEFCQ